MPKKILTILLFALCSCSVNKHIREKDYPKKNESFGVISLFSNNTSGYAYSFLSSIHKFNSPNDWDVNHHIELKIQSLLNSQGMISKKISYDSIPFEDSNKFFKNLELTNKNLPDYYIVIAPREAEKDDSGHWYDHDSSSIPWAAIDLLAVIPKYGYFSYIKHSDLDVPKNLLHKTISDQPDINFRIVSIGGFGDDHSLCNASFDLFLIDRKKNKLIAFRKDVTMVEKMPKFYSVDKFSDFSNFTSEEKIDIRNFCFGNLDYTIKKSLINLGLLEDRAN